MILCVGTVSSGKTTLLRRLLKVSETAPSSDGKPASKPAVPPVDPDSEVSTIPTVGVNIVTLSRPRGKKSQAAADVVVIREVGGCMAPLWHSYVEGGSTRGVLFVIDASSPETLGAATIHLLELLHLKDLRTAQVLIVFTNSDRKSSRSLSEIKSIMRLNHIAAGSPQTIDHVDLEAADGLQKVANWCWQFAVPRAAG